MLARIVLLNKKGLTLVEMMIALVILLLVFLALMQTALLSINANMNNLLRDEAVSVAEQHMIEKRNMRFDDPQLAATVNAPDGTEIRDFRNFFLTFTVTKTVTDQPPVVDPDNKQVDITVSWIWKGETFTHSINAVLRNPSLRNPS